MFNQLLRIANLAANKFSITLIECLDEAKKDELLDQAAQSDEIRLINVDEGDRQIKETCGDLVMPTMIDGYNKMDEAYIRNCNMIRNDMTKEYPAPIFIVMSEKETKDFYRKSPDFACWSTGEVLA